MTWRESYSELLHDSAAKWGLEVLPGRPLVGLQPGDTAQGIVGNPYQREAIEITETVRWEQGHEYVHVNLFTLNGLWGYCLSMHTNNEGQHYGAFLKFCQPYHSVVDALRAAGRRIARLVENRQIRRWAQTLGQPEQLELPLMEEEAT